jgi:putative tributyrin esterase
MARLFFMLLCAAAIVYGAQYQTCTIPSPSMHSSRKATVVLPDKYATGKDRFPVIYLLHGFNGDYTTWPGEAPLDTYADRYRIILVCPDAGVDSWYLDSQVKKDSRFETYIAIEVVDFIDSHYRTRTGRQGRVLIGRSMGGHGALTLLTRHPDRFCGAGSIQGIMELSQFPDQWNMTRVLGPFAGNEYVWHNASFTGMLDKLKSIRPAIIIDCGTSDFALDGSRKAHAALIDLKIDHDYYERPGAHTPDYAKRVLESHILYFSAVLTPAGS